MMLLMLDLIFSVNICINIKIKMFRSKFSSIPSIKEAKKGNMFILEMIKIEKMKVI